MTDCFEKRSQKVSIKAVRLDRCRADVDAVIVLPRLLSIMPGGGSSSGERVTITILRTSDASKVQVSFDSVSFLLVVDGHRLGGSVTCRYYLLSLT